MKSRSGGHAKAAALRDTVIVDVPELLAMQKIDFVDDEDEGDGGEDDEETQDPDGSFVIV